MTNAQAIALPRPATLVSVETKPHTRARVRIGYFLTGLSGALFILDASMKLLRLPAVVEGALLLGYPESTLAGIGIVLFACTLLYLIPRTSILGAVLLTGYFGGAVATNVRAEQSTFSIVAPVIFACIAWGGLWLREARLEQLLPLKQKI